MRFEIEYVSIIALVPPEDVRSSGGFFKVTMLGVKRGALLIYLPFSQKLQVFFLHFSPHALVLIKVSGI